VLEKMPTLSPGIERNLRIAIDSDYKELSSQIKAGIAELWRVNEGEAYAITRLEKPATLMVCCYQGSGVAGFAQYIVEVAKRNGMTKVAFHTERRGLPRLIKAAGLNVERAERLTNIFWVQI
jgi:hypothetical protein